MDKIVFPHDTTQQQGRTADGGADDTRHHPAQNEHARHIAQGRQIGVECAIAANQPGPHQRGQRATQRRPGRGPPHDALQQAFNQSTQQDGPKKASPTDQQRRQCHATGQEEYAGTPAH